MDAKRAARRALFVINRGYLNDDIATNRRIIKPRHPSPLNQPGWQMKQHINHARQPELRQRLGERSANAF